MVLLAQELWPFPRRSCLKAIFVQMKHKNILFNYRDDDHPMCVEAIQSRFARAEAIRLRPPQRRTLQRINWASPSVPRLAPGPCR